jgi:hypothetical protein
MRNVFRRRVLKVGCAIALLLCLLIGVLWFQLPALLEREFTVRLADAGYPNSSLHVESVGLHKFEIADISVAGDSWRLQLRNGTVSYHPFEVFRPEFRAVELDGMRIDLDLELEPEKSSTGKSALDAPWWEPLTQESQMDLPLRQLSVVDGLIRLGREPRVVSFPFELSVTNDNANQQIRGLASGSNSHARIRIQGRSERETGLKVAIEVELLDEWDSWLRQVLTDEMNAATKGLHLGPAQGALELLVRPNLLEPRARFTGEVASVGFEGIRLTAARVSGEYTPEGATIEGGASLGAEPFTFALHLDPGAGQAMPGSAGEFSINRLRFRKLELPRQWTGAESMFVSGGLEVGGRFRLGPGAMLDLEPEFDIDLERVEWPEQTLTVEGIRGIISGLVPESSHEIRTNLVTVDLIKFREYEVTDVTLGAARLSRAEFQIELMEAQWLDGQLRSTPITVGPNLKKVEAVLELQQVSLAKLSKLIPQFSGSIEGALNGRLPLQFEAGRFSLGAATLRLDRDRPARLQYPADGLLTKGIPPDTDRHEQLKLIEEALQDLQLTELRLDLQSPDHPQSPVRVRLEGTFSSAKAIIPVKFNLNVNGDVDEVLRLISIGKIELSL